MKTILCAHCGARAEVLSESDLPDGWVRRVYEYEEPAHENARTVTAGFIGWPSKLFDSADHADAWEREHPDYNRMNG